jgi:integrase
MESRKVQVDQMKTENATAVLDPIPAPPAADPAPDPFASLKKGNPERDRRHVRRVLDVAELQALVTVTRGLPVRRRLTGEARALLYATAAATGYRAAELAALTPVCFVLDADQPSIDLDGRHTKNGKPACQPIPPDLAAALRGFLAGKPAGEPVWPGRWSDRAAEMI